MGVEFLKVKSRREVEDIIRQLPRLGTEVVQVDRALSRVLAEDVYAGEPVPHFNRATMDGYAVRAKDTFGASESLPAVLHVVGSVEIGVQPSCKIGENEACTIPTGGALPAGADGVVMIEHTDLIGEKEIEVYKPIAPVENVLMVGDDISEGELLFKTGRRLRSQDLGVLTAVGITKLKAYKIPRVAIISTGNEIVPPEIPSPLPPAVVRDINTYVVGGLTALAGSSVGDRVLVPDDLGKLSIFVKKVLENHDVVLISGGSSVGSRDYTLRVIESLPDSEILVHGVGMRPGKPTIFGVSNGKYIWGLPGQPGSVTMVMIALVCPFLQHIQGVDVLFPFRLGTTEGILTAPVASVHGREDYVPVRFPERDKSFVEPIFGKSGMIKTLASSEGFILIPEHSEGYEPGQKVQVYLF